MGRGSNIFIKSLLIFYKFYEYFLKFMWFLKIHEDFSEFMFSIIDWKTDSGCQVCIFFECLCGKNSEWASVPTNTLLDGTQVALCKHFGNYSIQTALHRSSLPPPSSSFLMLENGSNFDSVSSNWNQMRFCHVDHKEWPNCIPDNID